MIVKTLVENTAAKNGFNTEHGLCLYIKTNKHKLLFDLGKSDLFIKNAIKMGVDLSSVDTVIISHGHYDHGGGLAAFLKINSRAKIYIHKKAFEKHYAVRLNGTNDYIGLSGDIDTSSRFILTEQSLVIDDELELFAGVSGNKLNPSSNKYLLTKRDNELVPDDFVHEQNLIISEGGKTALIAGCAHSGIINIVDHFANLKKSIPGSVIGGFHLYNRTRRTGENQETVKELGKQLKNTGSKYYTCHCTGLGPYNKLRVVMGENIEYISTGSSIEI